MGFFGKVFSKKESTKTIETTLELLPSLIEKNFSAREEELEMLAAKKISEIKYLHSKSLKLLEDIKQKELEEKANQRFNKAALTAKGQIEKQLEKLLQKIDPSDRGNTLSDVKAFVEEGNNLLLNELMAFRKNIAYTSAYLKEEMKELGETVQGMLKKFQELNKEIEKDIELFNFEKTKQKIKDLGEKDSELENIGREIEQISALEKEKQNGLPKLRDKVEEILSGLGMSELEKLKEEKGELAAKKQELKTEISSLLSTVDRPLQRFQSLVDSGRWVINKEQKHLLDSILTNPMLALKSDPNGKQFKLILSDVIKAIEEGKVELKEKEKEKRLNALNEILAFNFFERVFWKLNDLQKKQKVLEEKINKSTAQKELVEEENKIREIEKEINVLKERKENLQKKRDFIIEKIREETNSIIDFSEKLLGKKIILSNEKI